MALGGWIFSYYVGVSNLRYEIRKEEYNKQKESFTNINNLFSQYFEYIYDFINKTQELYRNGKEISEYDLTVFSASKMLKQNYIFNLINIDFPDCKIDIQLFSSESNKIEMFYTTMKNIKSNDNNVETYVHAITSISKVISRLTDQSNELMSQMNNINKIQMIEFGIQGKFRQQRLKH